MNTAPPQRTLRSTCSISGIGFFGGADVELTFNPARPGEGITFVRTDLPRPVRIPARVEHVADCRRRTVLQAGGARVEMVEHVLAALAGLGVDNCDVHVNAPEPPGCDGSCQLFVDRLLDAGFVEQSQPRRPFVVRRSVCVRTDDAILTAFPGPPGRLLVNYVLDYGLNNPIGRQCRLVDVTPESFRDELAASRTFLLADEARLLRSQGIGTRVGHRDLLIFGPDGVVENQLRYDDECVRHKILDLLGDLALLGSPVEGHIVASRSGHKLNAELVRALLATQEADSRESSPAPVVEREGVYYAA